MGVPPLPTCVPQAGPVLWVWEGRNSALRVLSCAEAGAGDPRPRRFHSPWEALGPIGAGELLARGWAWGGGEATVGPTGPST